MIKTKKLCFISILTLFSLLLSFAVSAQTNSTNGVDLTDIAEVGIINGFSEPQLTHKWITVDLKKNFIHPRVFIGPLSYNGTEPAHVRVRNVQRDSFELKVEEWSYLDKKHVAEDISYIVIENGTHFVKNGSSDVVQIEVGTAYVNHKFGIVDFNKSFKIDPVVFSQSQTFNGRQPIVTRNKNVSNDGFRVKVQEEEAKGWHLYETVAFLALEPGIYNTNVGTVKVDRTGNVVTHENFTINNLPSGNIFLANMQTTNGRNTACLRSVNQTGNSNTLFVEEEQSKDLEVTHITEDVGYMVFPLFG
jgi:hypothetical protein